MPDMSGMEGQTVIANPESEVLETLPKADPNISKMEVRVKMSRYYANGLSPSNIIDLLKKEYPAVSERTMWRYWAKRNEWLPSLTSKDIAKTTEATDKLLLAIEESRRMAYATYVKADNTSARVGAIGKYQDAIRLEAEFRQSLGLLPSRPLEIEAKGLTPANLVLQLWMPRVEAERQAQLGRVVIDPDGRQITTTSNPVAVSCTEVPKLEVKDKAESKEAKADDSGKPTVPT